MHAVQNRHGVSVIADRFNSVKLDISSPVHVIVMYLPPEVLFKLKVMGAHYFECTGSVELFPESGTCKLMQDGGAYQGQFLQGTGVLNFQEVSGSLYILG